MRDIVIFNDKFKPIDLEYFQNYGGEKYSDNYLKYTTNPKFVIRELIFNKIFFDNLLDVGCASGEVVRDFRRLGVDAYGIENNRDVLKKSVAPDYCYYGNMFDLSDIADKSYDVIYCNALMYAWPTEVLKILKSFNRIVNKAVYLCCPFLDNTTNLANDPYRVFLAKGSWWEKQFKEADFKKVSENIYSKN